MSRFVESVGQKIFPGNPNYVASTTHGIKELWPSHEPLTTYWRRDESVPANRVAEIYHKHLENHKQHTLKKRLKTAVNLLTGMGMVAFSSAVGYEFSPSLSQVNRDPVGYAAEKAWEFNSGHRLRAQADFTYYPLLKLNEQIIRGYVVVEAPTDCHEIKLNHYSYIKYEGVKRSVGIEWSKTKLTVVPFEPESYRLEMKTEPDTRLICSAVHLLSKPVNEAVTLFSR